MSTTSHLTPSVPADLPSPTLGDILISDQLWLRDPREIDKTAENAAYLAIVSQLDRDGSSVLQTLTDACIQLCMANRRGTAGISLLEPQPDGSVLFRWTVMSGYLAAAVGGTTPRDFSPCGVCLDAKAPVLFSHPERHFTYFRAAGVPFVEGLVLPFSVAGRPAGTLWILGHDAEQCFDREDARVMTELTAFASIAYSSAAHQAWSSQLESLSIESQLRSPIRPAARTTPAEPRVIG